MNFEGSIISGYRMKTEDHVVDSVPIKIQKTAAFCSAVFCVLYSFIDNFRFVFCYALPAAIASLIQPVFRHGERGVSFSEIESLRLNL